MTQLTRTRPADSDPAAGDADFSRAAIRRQVRRAMLQHPAVVYPGAAGLLGSAAAVLIGPGLWTLGLAIGGLVTAAAALGAGLSLFRETLAAVHVRRLAAEVEATRERRIGQTRRRLEEAGSRDGLDQFRRLSAKFQAFEGLLAEKLDARELTHLRYRGMAEQVFLATLDNLNQVADSLAGARAIDEGFIHARRAELAGQPDGPDKSAELEALDTRGDLLDQHRARVRELMAQNEQAMTRLDLTAAAVAGLRSGVKHTDMDLDTAMAELTRLAERARDFDQH
jgi:hypothetical protein